MKIEKPSKINMSMSISVGECAGYNRAVRNYEAWEKQQAEKVCDNNKRTICCLGSQHSCMLQVNEGYCCAKTCQYQVVEVQNAE